MSIGLCSECHGRGLVCYGDGVNSDHSLKMATDICKTCKGSGQDYLQYVYLRCHQCNGKGVVYAGHHVLTKHVTACGICYGSGQIKMKGEARTMALTPDERKTWEITPEKEVKEAVMHPKHYNTGKFEVIDVIEDWQLGFNDGNAVKYIGRHRHKTSPREDLEKALWYIARELMSAHAVPPDKLVTIVQTVRK